MIPVLPLYALCLGIVATPATIHLRGGEESPAGFVAVAVNESGVLLGPIDQNNADDLVNGRQPIVKLQVSWDRVASIDGWLADASKPYSETATMSWRARTRLERGDWVSAEPLLEQLFPRVRGRSGPTAGVIAEALTRARLRRGAHLLAIEPFLSLLQSSAGATNATPVLHASWASEAGLGMLVDPDLQLAPALPPVWARIPAVDAIASDAALTAGWDMDATQRGTPSRVTLLAMLYLEAAKFESGAPASVPPIKATDSGLQLVFEIVSARIGTSDQRAAARKLLRDRLRAFETPPLGPAASDDPLPSNAWIEAWVRIGIGRSLLRENSPDDRQAGVLQLLNLPARFAQTQPYLSGIALAEASAALRELGDATGADVLAAELRREYPTHPALDWEPMRLARPIPIPLGPTPSPVSETSKDQSSPAP